MTEPARRQAVGPTFSSEKMLYARDRSMDAVRQIAAAMRPGMTESEASDAARAILIDMGMQRIWHPVLVRFGAGTLKKFNERSDLDHVLGERWRLEGLGGSALYDFAAGRASAMGWVLNLDIKGHRVSDFPHAIYKAGNLGDFADCPATDLWILEIQIAHPTRPFGAFYEDLLTSAATAST